MAGYPRPTHEELVQRFHAIRRHPDESVGRFVTRFVEECRQAEGGRWTNYESARIIAYWLPLNWGVWAARELEMMKAEGPQCRPLVSLNDFAVLILNRWIQDPFGPPPPGPYDPLPQPPPGYVQPAFPADFNVQPHPTFPPLRIHSPLRDGSTFLSRPYNIPPYPGSSRPLADYDGDYDSDDDSDPDLDMLHDIHMDSIGPFDGEAGPSEPPQESFIPPFYTPSVAPLPPTYTPSSPTYTPGLPPLPTFIVSSPIYTPSVHPSSPTYTPSSPPPQPTSAPSALLDPLPETQPLHLPDCPCHASSSRPRGPSMWYSKYRKSIPKKKESERELLRNIEQDRDRAIRDLEARLGVGAIDVESEEEVDPEEDPEEDPMEDES